MMTGLYAICLTLSLAAGNVQYITGGNLLKNGELKPPCWHPDVPHYWVKWQQSPQSKTVLKPDDGGVLIHFKGTEYINQIRFKQDLKLEPGKVYEFQFDYRSDVNPDLHADATFWGTGVFMRSWWLAPAQEYTTVRGLFHVAENVKGNVTLTMQNRSAVRLWYRNIRLYPTSLGKKDIGRIIPDFNVHSVSSDDVFITPDNRKATADFIVNGFSGENLKKFRIEAEYYPSNGNAVTCRVKGRNIMIPMNRIPEGKSWLVGKLFDRKDNALVGMKRVEINRIMTLPSGVDLSRKECVRINGRKFFPIGIYAGNGWNFSVDELVRQGYNVIHTYASNREDVCRAFPDVKFNEKAFRNTQKLLDDAKRLGVYVMIQLPHRYTEKADFIGRFPQWLDVYKNHPALFGYYIDETRSIKNTPYPVIKAAYDAVHRYDPKHKWFAYENPDPNLRNSMDAIIVRCSPSVKLLCALNLGADKPVIHCFGQEDFMAQSAKSLDHNQSQFVMPVIWGARGVFYFIASNYLSKEVNPEYRLVGERVLKTVKRFSEAAPAVVSDDPLPAWANQVKTGGKMEKAIFALKDITYIFCGVAEGAGENGVLSFPVQENTEIRDLLNAETLSAEKNFTLSLKPGQAKIIRVK